MFQWTACPLTVVDMGYVWRQPVYATKDTGVVTAVCQRHPVQGKGTPCAYLIVQATVSTLVTLPCVLCERGYAGPNCNVGELLDK